VIDAGQEHRECSLRKEPQVEANVDHDQFHQHPGVHQGAKGPGLRRAEPPDPAGPIQRKHLAEYGRKPAEDREDSELVRAIENRAAAIAVTPAKRIQPTTSLTAADVIAITPIRVRASPYWRRIRPRIGTAVIARPTPTNRLYTEGLIAGASAGADQCPIMRPRTKDTLTGAIATARARRACISRVRPQ